MIYKITSLICCLCLLSMNGAFAQTQPNTLPITKVAAHNSIGKTALETGPAPMHTIIDDDINALPLDAVVLWGGPGDANGEFAGGLNDWTTTGKGSDNSNALWTWDAQGDASTGAYWGTRTPINSLSVGNGAAVFNSDFLDNNGTPGNFGNGLSPSPHLSELVSPTIDMTGHTNVALSFISFYRNFQSEVYVAYSNNDGATWSPNIRLFEDVLVNVSTANATESLVYLPGSGGTDKFKFKFIWDGQYYFWIIDDVAVIEQPRHDLVLESFFYTPQSWGQPQGHIDSDEFFFSVSVSNPGADAQTNVLLTAQIFDPNDDLVFEDVLVVDELAPGITDSSHTLDNTYFPAGLDAGTYRIEYSISADSTDQWDRDNVDGTTFAVTANTFQSETGNSNFAGENAIGTLAKWEIGNLYRAGADFMGEPYIATSITFAPFDYSSAGSLQGKSATIALVELKTTYEFDNSKDYLGDEDLILKGLASITFTNEAQNEILTVDLESAGNIGDPILLTEGAEYFALISYPDSTGNLFNSEIDYGDNRINFIAYSGAWFTGFLNSTDVPLVRLNIGILSSTDDKPLPETAMNIFPNPVGDQLTANIDLEVASKATITISDVSGRILQKRDYNNLGTSSVQFNTGSLANGVYYIRLVTPEGTRTIKFVVQK